MLERLAISPCGSTPSRGEAGDSYPNSASSNMYTLRSLVLLLLVVHLPFRWQPIPFLSRRRNWIGSTSCPNVKTPPWDSLIPRRVCEGGATLVCRPMRLAQETGSLSHRPMGSRTGLPVRRDGTSKLASSGAHGKPAADCGSMRSHPPFLLAHYPQAHMVS